MTRRGKRFALSTAAVGLVILVAAGFAAKGWVMEEYYIHLLRSTDDEIRLVAAEALAGHGTVVAIKFGQGGGLVIWGDEVVRSESIPADVVDTTGAGDSFDAGFIAARAALADGELGWLHTVRSTTLDPAPPPQPYLAVSGGIFRDCSVHDFDAIRFDSTMRKRSMRIYSRRIGVMDANGFVP